MDLIQKYNDIKNNINNTQSSNLINVGNTREGHHSGALKWKSLAVKERDSLKEDCSKRILLDIYCKIIPLDSNFVHSNRGMMKQDMDTFLQQKDMTGQQYLMSCSEKTNAPLLEFVNRSIGNIGKTFMDGMYSTLKNAQESNISIPPPLADLYSEETEEQLAEIQNDDEYKNFISTLKQKTVNKTVEDIGGMVQEGGENKNIPFDVSNESSIETCLDYFHNKIWKENTDLTEYQNEAIIGLAIRESTLNIIDKVFNQPDGDFKTFNSNIRFGKGIVMNESVVDGVLANIIQEGGEYPYPLYDIRGFDEYQQEMELLFESTSILYLESKSDESKIVKLGRMIKNLIIKIKNFIIKIFKPLLKKLNMLADNEDNIAIIESLEGVGIKLLSDNNTKVKTEATVYNPLTFSKHSDGNHNLRFLHRWIMNKLGLVENLHDVDRNIEIVSRMLKTNSGIGEFSYEIPKIEIDATWIIEEYVEHSYKTLDKCLELQKLVENSEEADRVLKQNALNAVVIFSNRINASLTLLHLTVHTFLDPLTKDTVAKFKSADHIIEFVKLYENKTKSNYLSIKQTLLKLLKRSKYSFGHGASRIYIPGDKDSQYGYKIASTKKGIIDNKMEVNMWERLSKTPLSKYFIPITKMDGKDDLIVVCRKATDVGKVPVRTAYKLLKDIEVVKSKESDPLVRYANFDADVIVKMMELRTVDGIYNKGNVAIFENLPVLIDYANVLQID